MIASAMLVPITLRRSWGPAVWEIRRGAIRSDQIGPIPNITIGWRKSQ